MAGFLFCVITVAGQTYLTCSVVVLRTLLTPMGFRSFFIYCHRARGDVSTGNNWQHTCRVSTPHHGNAP